MVRKSDLQLIRHPGSAVHDIQHLDYDRLPCSRTGIHLTQLAIINGKRETK